MYAPNGEVAWRRDITSNTRKKKGAQSWTYAQLDLPSFKGMTWAIEAQGTEISAPNAVLQLSNNTSEKNSDGKYIYGFNRPQGIAVDNNPQSDYFGRIYVALPKAA